VRDVESFATSNVVTEGATPSLLWVDPEVGDVEHPRSDDEIHVRAFLRPTMFGKAKACARRWFLESALRAPADEPWKARGADRPQSGVRANVRGNAIHAAFESLAFGRRPSDPIGGSAAGAGKKATPRDHIDVACTMAGIADASDVKEIRTLVERAEKAFEAWDVGARILAAKPGEVRSEQAVSFEVEGLEVAGTLDLLFAPEGDAARLRRGLRVRFRYGDPRHRREGACEGLCRSTRALLRRRCAHAAEARGRLAVPDRDGTSAQGDRRRGNPTR
jgi:hypothetical protein